MIIRDAGTASHASVVEQLAALGQSSWYDNIRAARREGRSGVTCIVLGRHADEARVLHWLEVAASVPELVGFAIGRSTFWDPLKEFLGGMTARRETIDRIARSVVSSSRNCAAVLASAGIADLFDARVDGVVAEAKHLPGKPAPDTYLAASLALGIRPAEAVVFEDALVGVEAGRAGHFGYVVGVDRLGQAAELRRHGADVVVNDLASLLEAA
jgi:beta-phosphoglucomutase-like phosphatase (HAD superfamily)